MSEHSTMPEGRERFRVEVARTNEGVVLVEVGGDVDLHSGPELRDRLGEVIGEGASRVVVDLSDATFLDSMALGVLLGAKKRLAAAGGDMRLVVPTSDIRRIFEITMLDRVFELHDSRGDAVAQARDED